MKMEDDNEIQKKIQEIRDKATMNEYIESGESECNSGNNKINLINVNKQWNDANEELLVSIGENAASYRWMHEKCSRIYNNRDYAVSFTLVIFGVILSIKTLIEGDKYKYVLEIIMSIFTYLLTVGNIVNSFLNNRQLSISHKSISGKYAELYNDIRQLMTMYRQTRPIANDYINETLKLYDNYILESPDILDSVVKEYKRIVDEGVSQPNVAQRIQRIKVITEKPLGNIFKKVGKEDVVEKRNVNNRNMLQMMSQLNRRNDVTDLEANKMLEYEKNRFNNIVKDD
jgi:hypothetical protein